MLVGPLGIVEDGGADVVEAPVVEVEDPEFELDDEVETRDVTVVDEAASSDESLHATPDPSTRAAATTRSEIR